MVYALIGPGNAVENVIVVDEPSFLPLIEADWAHVVPIDERTPQPGIGWTYDAEADTFAPPLEA